jgi:tetratricopeptide (TPR) repeat protein
MRGSLKGSRSLAIRKFVQPFSIPAWVGAVALLCAAPAPSATAQQGSPNETTGIAVQSSPQLFATMCALDAAGFNADESTLAEMPSRLALRQELLDMQGPATEALRQFYREHTLSDPGETLSPYITFALVAGPPPLFHFQMSSELLPPDVMAIDGFQEVLMNFYHEAHLGARWASIEPEYDRSIARYQAPVRRIVTVTNAYLREVLKSNYGRSFTVYVEPLVGKRTNFRNYGDHYAIVVGTGSEMPLDEIQHAYLHFMLDPFPLKYRDQLQKKNILLNISARAPRLPVEYQNDFLALVDECLIKAVELRLRRLPPDQLEAALTDADQSGFILVRPLVGQLQKFEKDSPSMAYYFPEVIKAIDIQAEEKRLQNIQFAPLAPVPAAKSENAAAADPPLEMDRWLDEGDREIAAKDIPAALAIFEKTLAKYPNQPRAVYGLAIASVLFGNAERARELFEMLVSGPATPGSQGPGTAADPAILAWSHVYLGRIHDLIDERDAALREYGAALKVEGAPESARVAAQRGVEVAYKPPARASESGNGSKSP